MEPGEWEHFDALILEIKLRERLKVKTWVSEQLMNYRALPQYGATGPHMFLEHRGRVAQLEEIHKWLHETDPS